MVKTPIIFLHGLGSDSGFWNDFFSLFPASFLEKYEPKKIDIPRLCERNSIETITFFLKASLEKLKVSKCILVGHSLGGLVSLSFVSNFPGIVEKIVIISTPITKKKSPQAICELLTNKKTLAIIKKLEKFIEGHKTIEEKISGVTGLPAENLIDNCYLEQAPFCFKNINSYDWEKILSKINIPVLCLYGSKDKLVSFYESNSIYQLIKNVKIKEVEGGHYLVSDCPKQVIAEIIKFLQFYISRAFLRIEP